MEYINSNPVASASALSIATGLGVRYYKGQSETYNPLALGIAFAAGLLIPFGISRFTRDPKYIVGIPVAMSLLPLFYSQKSYYRANA